MKKTIFTVLSIMLALSVVFSVAAIVGASDDNPRPAEIWYLKGDANINNDIMPSDARIVLRHAAELESLTYEARQICDMNGDGKINAADARIILRTAAGLEFINYAVVVKRVAV